jgi:mono/diheme cytochrome c family protein
MPQYRSGATATKLKAFVCCAFPIVALFVAASAQTRSAGAGKVDFARDVRPIIEAHCIGCHTGSVAGAELRLDSRETMLAGGTSGPAIVPSHGAESLLVQRVLGEGGKPRMPLGGKRLTDKQIATLRTWIDQGALSKTPAPAATPKVAPEAAHWAYMKPVQPQSPTVRNKAWVRNPIDAFVLARLERERLVPSPEASKETLIRRVTLDLTGLLPTPAEIDAFLADTSPDAYEKLVDRLLASPHFGERWARPWLDLARYADTNGYEKDRRRSIWKYRDWVVDAFNSDMPFDRFTVEQIAGDMLPNATEAQRIATGFNRNAMNNEEGGVDQMEARWQTIVDRVDTTATVWLGSTLACAQCHDHKFDPFTQRDFYRFFAFFENADYTIEGDASISEDKLVEPRLDTPKPEQQAHREKLEAERAEVWKGLEAHTAALDAEQVIWERGVAAARARWETLAPERLSSAGPTVLEARADGSVLARGGDGIEDVYTVETRTSLQKITGVLLEALPDPSLPRGGPGRDTYGNFVLTGIEITVAPGNGAGRAETLTLADARADDGQWDLPARSLVEPEGKGWGIDTSHDEAHLPRQIIFRPATPFGFEGGTVVTVRLKQSFPGQSIGRFRLAVTTAENPFVVVDVPVRLRPILELAPTARTEAQRKDLSALFASLAPSRQPARERLASLERTIDALGIPSTLVMREQPRFERPFTELRVRGSYLNRGGRVYADVPGFLNPLSTEQMPNRLGLANWLVDRENPLVARVEVNRIWEQYFGRGIVETSEDFGTQGARPTHPELLDWLATEFMARGWSLKAVHRLVVTSATYRQSSRITPELLERDPDNRLLTRGSRFRVEAEMVRDIALAASGLLDPTVGGPSVFPYQPPGIWSLPFNDDKWITSEGRDRFRRSLYTFWRRTSPYPSLVAFDAPSREVCTARRPRTNTPLQALTTLNDPAFFEMAKGLAKRMLVETTGDEAARAAYGFRLCTSRRPGAAEVERLIALYRQQLARYASDTVAARKVSADFEDVATARPAEFAAWTVVANVLLNLDETLTKE